MLENKQTGTMQHEVNKYLQMKHCFKFKVKTFIYICRVNLGILFI